MVAIGERRDDERRASPQPVPGFEVYKLFNIKGFLIKGLLFTVENMGILAHYATIPPLFQWYFIKQGTCNTFTISLTLSGPYHNSEWSVHDLRKVCVVYRWPLISSIRLRATAPVVKGWDVNYFSPWPLSTDYTARLGYAHLCTDKVRSTNNSTVFKHFYKLPFISQIFFALHFYVMTFFSATVKLKCYFHVRGVSSNSGKV